MRPKLAGCRVRGRKTGASVQLFSDRSLWLCHWPTEHLCAGQVLGASYGNAMCQNDLFRSDPRLEIRAGVFGSRMVLLVGLELVGWGSWLTIHLEEFPAPSSTGSGQRA